MATWTLVKTIANALSNGSVFFTDDGVNVYYRDTNDIIQFNPLTLDTTVIGDLSSDFGSGIITGFQRNLIVIFKNELYLVLVDNLSGGDNFQVWKWDTDNWTKVLGSNAFDIPGVFGIWSSLTDIVALGEVVGGAANSGFHSSDGENWSTSTISTIYGDGLPSLGNSRGNMDVIAAIIKVSDSTNKSIFSYVNGVWSVVDPDPANEYKTSGPEILHWAQISGDFRYSSDWAIYSTPSDATIQPIPSMLRMVDSVGWKRTGTNLALHQFNGSEWAAGETVVSSALVSKIDAITRLDDGNVVCMVSPLAGSTNWLYLRDTPLPAPGGRWTPVAKFYQGTNQLVERSSLPMLRTNPSSMVVGINDDTYIASSEAASVMVAKAVVADDYATWENISTGTDDSTGIKAMEKV